MAQNIIDCCPVCSGQLAATRLSCQNCGLELSGQFRFPKFMYLSDQDLYFIDVFIQTGGNLKELQASLHLSYPAAKKRLYEIQTALGQKETASGNLKPEAVVKSLPIYKNESSTIKAIKESLNRSSGLARLPLPRGKEFYIWYEEFGNGLHADNLPQKQVLTWNAFEAAMELLEKSQGRAPKGNAMKSPLGQGALTLNTVEGYVAARAYGLKQGSFVPRKISALSAILSWAGLCKNGRGYLESLTP